MDTMLSRGGGILMPISSLPSPYGIGTLGACAYRFVEQLQQARQKYWQVLPLGPTSYGDSPYQSFSAFAGNPYFIDLEFLIGEGLLELEAVNQVDWGGNEEEIAYDILFARRFPLLKQAFQKSGHKETDEYQVFLKGESHWLEDYSFYMALKGHFDNQEWLAWDEDIRLRKPEAILHYQALLADEIEFWKFCQYKFFQQWKRLKAYANAKGIGIIGDIPIYVALDSADVWVNTALFQLSETSGRPLKVAGVPPDDFSDDGQLWGNPLYNWERMEAEDFHWWKQRMAASAKIYDVLRIDHFLGIVKYFSIPYGAADGKVGEYLKGPGRKLLDAITPVLGEAKIIAEDLGVANPEVQELLKVMNYPGMKVLEFAFGGDRTNEHLPHNYYPNLVAYVATHDNDTLRSYLESRPEWERRYITDYLDVSYHSSNEEIMNRMLTAAYASVASVTILQMQDILMLPGYARMNFPSTLGNNWRWRMKAGAFTEHNIHQLARLADIYGR